ncbi:MAG TPA: hypothetical protein VG013_15385 [Gemmataceae bacterium]|jgi:hypothetical protein|nr:hypothetical protein [Gemmataceae bacterium]
MTAQLEMIERLPQKVEAQQSPAVVAARPAPAPVSLPMEASAAGGDWAAILVVAFCFLLIAAIHLYELIAGLFAG